MIGYDDPMALGQTTWVTGRERWCSASFFVIRKEAFVGYDEGYGLGGYDDWDFFYRLRGAGWKTAYTNRACYQHKHSSTQLALDQVERFERDMRSKERFRKKFGGYAEELFALEYPEQMGENYYEFLNTI